MIDFSTLQGLTIPEGVVTQIADASGRVLWKQKPKNATVTIKFEGGIHGYFSYDLYPIVIDGVGYDWESTVVSVPLGAELVCLALGGSCDCGSKDRDCSIYLNGSKVSTSSYLTGYKKYNYSISSDVVITVVTSTATCTDCKSDGDEYRAYATDIYITET